jgi:hypothetical protein
MKKNNMFSKLISAVMLVSLGFVTSCMDEEKLTAGDTAAISEEAITDSYFQDLDDMSNIAIEAPTSDQYKNGGGRVATTITIVDDRFCESTVTVTIEPLQGSTLEYPKGKITVDFGPTGCTDPRLNVRKGKVFFEYNGPRFQAGSFVKITTDNYYINGTKLEGTRISTNVTENQEVPKFNVTLENGKATFIDSSIATRESDITWSWIKGDTRALDELVIDKSSTATGVTRTGREYEVSLTEDLKYQRSCFIAVDGIKKYLVDGSKEIIVDYGSGDCQSVSVTVNGVTRSIKVY